MGRRATRPVGSRRVFVGLAGSFAMLDDVVQPFMQFARKFWIMADWKASS